MNVPAIVSDTHVAKMTGIPRRTVCAWRNKPHKGARIHANALKVGENAGHWKGDEAKPESVKVRGRVIARKLYAKPDRCENCNGELGRSWARHHKDGSTSNNDRGNILIVCQSCHMKLDNPQHRERVRTIAKVKYDVSNAQPQQFEVPKPGVYEAAIEEMSHGSSSSGNPMFTIKFKLTKGDHKDARIWYYILTDGTQEWRLREFTDALGLKPKGELDTDQLTGMVVQLRTAIDPARDGYDEKARVKNVLPAEGTSVGGGGDEEDEPYDQWSVEDLKEEAEARELKIEGRKTKDKLVKALEADDETAEEEDKKGGEDEGDDEEELTKADLAEMSRDELKDLIKEEELEISVRRATKDDDIRAKIAEALELEDDEEEEEGKEESKEESKEEDEEEFTRADLEEMSRDELKQLIKDEELEITVRRAVKDDQLREKIAKALELDEDEEEKSDKGGKGGKDEEEEGDDTAYEEWEVSELKAELKERGLKTEGRKSILVGRLKKDDASGEEPF